MAGIAVWVQPAAIVHHRVQPSRLELPALIAASRRVGWGFCRRDFRAYGGLGLTALCLARLCKFAIFGPFRYGMARLSGNQPALLDLRLYAVRNGNYVMAAASCLLPMRCVQWLKLEAPVFRDEAGRATNVEAVAKKT